MKGKSIYILSLVILCLGFGISAKLVNNDKYFEIIKNIEIYSNVYKELNKNYVEDIDPSVLMRTGIDAMVGSLDPFTNYISETQVVRYQLNTQGRYEGIGILVGNINGEVTITEVTEGGPAQIAGIKAADKILAINGSSVIGKSDDEVNQIMRGAPGTDIQIRVERPGEDKPLDMNVSRDQVNIPNVPVAELLDGDIAYVSLTTFTQQAAANIEKALRKLQKELGSDLQGVVLDLRNNGGGLLREAIAVSNLFVDKGNLIVTTKGKVRERDKSYSTMKNGYNIEVPVTVLINKSSASASEIVSGVIQDYDRGVLIGQRSYGKGLVQNTQEVGYNSRVKLTTSKYYIPSGRCIQSVEYENGEPVDIEEAKRSKFKTINGRTVLDGGGVKPDVVIKKPAKSEFVQALMKDHMIFKYVTNYVLEHTSIDSAATYRFADYDKFVAFCKSKNYSFISKSEKAVEKLQKELNGISLEEKSSTAIESVKNLIAEDKADDYAEHKDVLIDLIEEEIIGRYYYQRGKILNNLNSDPEVQEAISILRDTDRYDAILNPA